jgi:hypothetical protein
MPHQSKLDQVRIGFLSYSPGPGAILFVVAGSFVHDGGPVATPNWRIFIIQVRNSFRLGWECAESRAFRQVEGNYLPKTLIYRFRSALNETFWNFN